MGRIAGFMIIIGSLIFILAASPIGKIYGTQDFEARMARITASRSAYVFSQVLFAVGAVATAIGFARLSPGLRSSARPGWLPTLASLLLLLGSAVWVFFIYQRTVRPEICFRDYASVPWQAWAYLALTAIALLLFGIGFLQAGYPQWMAYATVLVPGLVTAGAILIPEWMPPQLTYLLTLDIGIIAALNT